MSADRNTHLGPTCDHCSQPGWVPRSPHNGPPEAILRVAIPEGIFSVHRGCVEDWFAGTPPGQRENPQ
jgi:hypothetical protein